MSAARRLMYVYSQPNEKRLTLLIKLSSKISKEFNSKSPSNEGRCVEYLKLRHIKNKMRLIVGT